MPSVPNAAWVADITYISTAEGWLYLALTMVEKRGVLVSGLPAERFRSQPMPKPTRQCDPQ